MGKRHEARDWPTRAEMEVMRMLQNETGGMYGLEIVEASKNTIKRGSVYVLVGRLEEKGFVKAQLPKADPTHPGLPRRIYKLTAEGMRVLAAAEEVGLAAGV
jgi:DNA-binding PadR family transcriptional regulator